MLDLQKMRSLGSKLKIQLIKGPLKREPDFSESPYPSEPPPELPKGKSAGFTLGLNRT